MNTQLKEQPILTFDTASRVSASDFLEDVFKKEAGQSFEIHEELINPQLVKYLKVVGFDKRYTKAQGPYLFDKEGNEFLDFISGYSVFNIGRNHPRLKQALIDTVNSDLPNLVQMEISVLSAVLAKKLISLLSPKLDMVFFANSGSEAVEGAIKFARCVTKREKIVSCQKSFHGMTYGSLSLMDSPMWRGGFGPFVPECKAIEINDAETLEAELCAGDVAAFIAEPIQAEGGVRILEDSFLKKAEELCRKYGTLLILDEVQTGLGRTGKFFAMEHSGVSPDMLLLGKGLGGGMVPVSAIITKRNVISGVYSDLPHFDVHHHTFCQNNLAMAAAIATLDIIQDEKLTENAERMGTLLRDGLIALKDKHKVIKEVRGRGLMIGIEFGDPKPLLAKAAFNAVGRLAPALYTHLFITRLINDYGILTQLCSNNMHTLKLSPPLVVTEKEINYFLKSFDEILKGASRFPSSFWTKGMSLLKKAKSEL